MRAFLTPNLIDMLLSNNKEQIRTAHNRTFDNKEILLFFYIHFISRLLIFWSSNDEQKSFRK